MLGRAKLPPVRPGVGCSIINLPRSNNNGHSSFLAQFEAIRAPFSRTRRPLQAQQGARQPRGREALSRDEYLRRSCPRSVQNEIQNALNKRGMNELSKKRSGPRSSARPRPSSARGRAPPTRPRAEFPSSARGRAPQLDPLSITFYLIVL